MGTTRDVMEKGHKAIDEESLNLRHKSPVVLEVLLESLHGK